MTIASERRHFKSQGDTKREKLEGFFTSEPPYLYPTLSSAAVGRGLLFSPCGSPSTSTPGSEGENSWAARPSTGCRRVFSPVRLSVFECGGKQRCSTVYLFSKATERGGATRHRYPTQPLLLCHHYHRQHHIFSPSSFNSRSLLFLADKKETKEGWKGEGRTEKVISAWVRELQILMKGRKWGQERSGPNREEGGSQSDDVDGLWDENILSASLLQSFQKWRNSHCAFGYFFGSQPKKAGIVSSVANQLSARTCDA